MAALARLLATFGFLLLAAGQTYADSEVDVGDEHSEEVDDIPDEHNVEEGSMTEWLEHAAESVEDTISGAVHGVENAAESVVEDVESVFEGGEEYQDESHQAAENSHEAPEHQAEEAEHETHESEEAVHHTEEAVHSGEESHEANDFISAEHHAEEQEEDNSGFHWRSQGAMPFIEYSGFLEVPHHHLHKAALTLTQAKEWCHTHSNCIGFYHQGPADEGPFEMTFTDHWELNSEHSLDDPHTAYKKFVKPTAAEELLLEELSHHEEAHDEGHEVHSEVTHEVPHVEAAYHDSRHVPYEAYHKDDPYHEAIKKIMTKHKLHEEH